MVYPSGVRAFLKCIRKPYPSGIRAFLKCIRKPYPRGMALPDTLLRKGPNPAGIARGVRKGSLLLSKLKFCKIPCMFI
jgi:hypothetical protein